MTEMVASKWYLIGSQPGVTIDKTVSILSGNKMSASLAYISLGAPGDPEPAGTLPTDISMTSFKLQPARPDVNFVLGNWGKINVNEITPYGVSIGVWVLTRERVPPDDPIYPPGVPGIAPLIEINGYSNRIEISFNEFPAPIDPSLNESTDPKMRPNRWISGGGTDLDNPDFITFELVLWGGFDFPDSYDGTLIGTLINNEIFTNDDNLTGYDFDAIGVNNNENEIQNSVANGYGGNITLRRFQSPFLDTRTLRLSIRNQDNNFFKVPQKIVIPFLTGNMSKFPTNINWVRFSETRQGNREFLPPHPQRSFNIPQDNVHYFDSVDGAYPTARRLSEHEVVMIDSTAHQHQHQ